MGTIRIGVRLHDVPGASIEERLHAAAEAGFTSVHLASKLLFKEWGCKEEGLTEERAKQLVDMLQREGLVVDVFGCYKNLATPDSEQEKANTRAFSACGRFARWIGAPMVGSETGRPNAASQITEGRKGERALATLIRQAGEAAAALEDEGSRLALEPGWNEVTCTPERAAQALDGIGRPDVGIILDPVSLLHPTCLASQDALIEEALDLLGDRILALHAKDYEVIDNEDAAGWCDGSGRRLVCHGAGTTGAFDFGPVARWAQGQDGIMPCIVENGTPETFAKSLAYLRSFMQ